MPKIILIIGGFMAKNRNYDADFKREAVRMVLDDGIKSLNTNGLCQ
jgi:transposase-like protein